MAKLIDLSLDDLYARKITSSVEAAIMPKEDFTKKSCNWCDKVCKLKNKDPSEGALNLSKATSVDVLIIQDYQAFDEPKFWKRGAIIEKQHLGIIQDLATKSFKTSTGSKLSYSVTSMLKCGIKKEDIKRGKPPTDAVLMKCRPYLLEEIKVRKPKIIISLNTSITKVLGLKKHSNYNNRGEIIALPDGTPVVITLHPRILTMLRQNSSGKLWGPDFYSVILRDFQKAAAVVEGRLEIPNLEKALERAKKQIHIARSLEDVISFCNELERVGNEQYTLSFDLETTSLDPYLETAKIITAQFGFREESTGLIKVFVIPLWHRENKGYSADKAWEYITRILLNPNIRKIGHNIKFDITYTFVTTGVRIVSVAFDTMLLLHAVNSGLQGMYGLKRAVWDWLPETGLGGYEDKLPKLTKIKTAETTETDEEEDDVEEEYDE